MDSIQTKLKSGQQPRLIPLSSSAEIRATSALLSILSVVPTFAKVILEIAGARIGKRSKITCFTEVVFEGFEEDRPDGLVIVDNGGSDVWTALIESKIGTAHHEADQLNRYVKLCKAIGAKSLITISDQYAISPTHHPTFTPTGQSRKYLNVVHFSWLSLIAQAQTSIHEKAITDIEQAFLLNELIRYLRDSKSGIKGDIRMHADWSVVSNQIQNNERLRKSSPELINAVRSWHQTIRYLSIQLTIQTGYLFSVFLTRTRQNDPDLTFSEDQTALVNNHSLNAEIEIQDFPSKLAITASLTKRTIELSTRISAPTNRESAKGRISWFVKQFDHSTEMDPIIRVYWPKSPLPSTASLSQIEAKGASCLIDHKRRNSKPVRFEVAWVIDLKAKFTGTQNFPKEVAEASHVFFENVINKIKIPRPKVSVKQKESISTEQTKSPVEQKKPEPNALLKSEPKFFRIIFDREKRYLNPIFNEK